MTENNLTREQILLGLRAFIIAGVVIWIYSPAFRGGWIWDDAGYLSSHVQSDVPGSWWRNWLQPGLHEDYFPIESTVSSLQWHLWHNNTLGYHLTNVFLHVTSALLVWRLFGKIGVRCAWLGGLLFALHPLMVESVAWMVELKNTLSLPPLLLAMGAYLDYDKDKRRSDYWLALGLFLVAMLCKASVMMLPTVILLHAWWKRRRIQWKDLRASAPFFAVSLPLGLLAGCLNHQTDSGPALMTSALSRADTAGWTIFFFFSKCLLPIGLMPVYPGGLILSPSPYDILPALLLVLLVGLPWFMRKTWGRHALLGIGFFLLNLAPVLGFVSMNSATMVWSMDHLVYIPVIGLIGLCIAAWRWVEERCSEGARIFCIAVLATGMSLLAWESHSLVKNFAAEETFWKNALVHDPTSPLVHTNLGAFLLHGRRMAEAKEQFEQALHSDSNWYEAHYDLGLYLQQTGRLPAAVAQYQEAVRIDPKFTEAQNNLGMALSQTGQLPEAIAHLKIALQLNPKDPEVHYNLANALNQSGLLSDAVEQYELALGLNPHFAEAHYSLANALIQTGRLTEAIDHYGQALRIKPDYADAHTNLGNTLLQLGQFPQAVEEYEQTLRITPKDVDVRDTLALVLMKTGRISEAVEQFKIVLQIDPQNANARNQLATIKAMK